MGMETELIILICLAMVGTGFLSGVFGMAGGLVLIGFLLFVMPVPEAMALHAVTQIASNIWRAVLWWRAAVWQIVAAYMAGCLIALGVGSVILCVPDRAVALLALGVIPFIGHVASRYVTLDPESPRQGVLYGTLCMSLMMLTGVAGPILDQFFLAGNLDRRQIVATKGFCQVFGHAIKLAYFGGIVTQAAELDPTLMVLAVAASFAGTMLSKKVLEAMSDAQFRRWAGALTLSIAGYYVAYGGYLMSAG
jgi:uncharacterized membrane protein YfcA